MGTFSQLFTPKLFYTNVNCVERMKTVDFIKDCFSGRVAYEKT